VNQIVEKSGRLRLSWAGGAVGAAWVAVAPIVAGLCAGCDDRPPPCHPDGEGNGTIAGPTPTPPWGPGGPGDPPDRADAPDMYSTNAEGEVCLCSPYQSGCTPEPIESKSCVRACNAGRARFSLYCQNPDLVEDPLSNTCEDLADQGLSACLKTRPTRGTCEDPCEELTMRMEKFCREHATKKGACWENSNQVRAACRAQG
jgi:hypothetical protein